MWLIFIFKTADAMPERFGGTCCAVLVTRGCAGSSRTVHRRRKTAGGLLAAVFGLIDWLAIPAGTRAKRIGLLHALSNVLAILGFALAFWMRYANRDLPRRLGYSASKSSRWSWALSAAGSVESSLTASAWVLIATRT